MIYPEVGERVTTVHGTPATVEEITPRGTLLLRFDDGGGEWWPVEGINRGAVTRDG